MEIIKITPSESKIWEQVWRIYIDSFPEWERRRISSHMRACEENDFHTYIALDNGNLLGLIFYWQHDKTIYIEHLAVNPAMRGKSVGSQIIKCLIEEFPGFRILLEIDPPVDDTSKRRLAFYQKLGFTTNDYDYTHPSYSRSGNPHELRIMSYPDTITPDHFEEFKEYLAGMVMKYID